MGRGKGGSTSHGKRTPGGIQTSSAIKMSSVGEVEAKHGVLGDADAGVSGDDKDGLRPFATQEFIDRNTQEILKAITSIVLKKDGKPMTAENQRAVLNSPEGQQAAEQARQAITDLASSDMAVAKKEAPVFARQGWAHLTTLEKPSQRSEEELDKMMSNEAAAFKRVGIWDGIIKALYKNAVAAGSSRDAKDIFLRVKALTDSKPGAGGFTATVGTHLRERDGAIEATPEDVKPDATSPFYDDGLPHNLIAYKAMVGSPEGRKVLAQLGGDISYSVLRHGNGTPVASEAKKALDQHAKPMHQITNEGIDDIRRAFGLDEAEVPGYVKQVLAGQPVAEKLYRLVQDQDASKHLEEYMNDAINGSYVDKFRASKYGQTPGLTDDEASVMVAYTSTFFHEINSYLRKFESHFSDYSNAKTEDMKDAVAREIQALLNKRGLRALVSTFMSGAMKVLHANADERKTPYVVTRGTEMPHTVTEGEYFYDAGAGSSALRGNQGKWEHNPEQMVLATDKAIDARPFSLFGNDEEEFIILPGVVFKADLVTTYRPEGDGMSDGERQVIIGRQANLGKEGAPLLVVPEGKWEGHDLIRPRNYWKLKDGDIEKYEARYGQGTDLLGWLLGKPRAARRE